MQKKNLFTRQKVLYKANKKMTNAKKINGKQKEIMAAGQKHFAKLFARTERNEQTMGSKKLNMAGPPIKETKSWQKDFTDQKHQAKKKLSLNMTSKKKTGGGPFEEMPLTPAEKQIVQAAGIGATVEGLSSIKTFGSSKEMNEFNIEEIKQLLSSENSDNENKDKVNVTCTDKKLNADCESAEKMTLKVNKRSTTSENKLNLLKSNIEQFEKSQDRLNKKLDRLLKLMERSIELKEKSIKIKEEEHIANLAIKKIDLEKKTIE